MKKPVLPKPRKRQPARDAAKPAPTSPVKSKRSADRSFPIVGIGASAGGLEALVQFLEHVPADSGMAFAVIQHLDPTQKGMLPELLQRATTMKVMQVKDRTKVQPDCVYVIPSNSDMSLLHGTLHLLAPTASRADITAAKKVEAGLRERHGNLARHSVEQGRALDRALGRLPVRDARPQLRKAEGKSIRRAAGTAGKPKP